MYFHTNQSPLSILPLPHPCRPSLQLIRSTPRAPRLCHCFTVKNPPTPFGAATPARPCSNDRLVCSNLAFFFIHFCYFNLCSFELEFFGLGKLLFWNVIKYKNFYILEIREKLRDTLRFSLISCVQKF